MRWVSGSPPTVARTWDFVLNKEGDWTVLKQGSDTISLLY